MAGGVSLFSGGWLMAQELSPGARQGLLWVAQGARPWGAAPRGCPSGGACGACGQPAFKLERQGGWVETAQEVRGSGVSQRFGVNKLRVRWGGRILQVVG